MINDQKTNRRGRILKISVVSFLLLGVSVFLGNSVINNVKAVNNLVSGGSFEDNLEQKWVNWKAPDNSRSYDFHRSYEVSSIGNGSYSAAITASGTPQDEIAGIISDNNNNSFQVEGGKHYYLRFYAKASQEMDIFSLMEDANNDYEAITEWNFSEITTEWKKYLVEITPTSTAESAVLMMGYNNMPEGATLYLDGVTLFEKNIQVKTNKVKGRIGQNRYVDLTNLGFFSSEDVRVQLPYYNPETGEAGTTKVEPTNINGSRVFFDLKEGTFPGIGRVYVAGEMVGEFQYQVSPRVEEMSPVLARGGRDMVIHGSGFIPRKDNTFVVMHVKDSNGQKYKKWLDYSHIDSDLSSLTVEVPADVVKGHCYVVTSFTNMKGETVEQRSNNISYEVKPEIERVEWSKKGYEQVGDKIRIYGKGLAGAPRVNFYDSEGEHVGKKGAKVVSVSEEEIVVEVKTPRNINELSVTVEVGGSMSKKEDALSYVAKPELKKINTQKKRKLNDSSSKIPASKTGEEIVFLGQGFNPAGSSTVKVEFQGLNERIATSVPEENIKNNGSKIKVSVPDEAQNGYVNVMVNGKKSNYRPLEIIPSVVGVSPDDIWAGSDITIKATGVGNNKELTNAIFSLGKGEQKVKKPTSIERSGPYALVKVDAPEGLSNSRSNVNLQYDRWSSDKEFDLHVSPHIDRASINLDNNILTIKGHGFSLDPRENKITYKYADEDNTVVDPKTNKLGVYPTEEGQEIRIKVKDDYHYGYISVQVGEETSNEVNFGPVKIKRLSRNVEYIESEGTTKGVLYISGYNFGDEGGVKVGDQWAEVHYRSKFFIIAVIDEQYLYDNPVVISRK